MSLHFVLMIVLGMLPVLLGAPSAKAQMDQAAEEKVASREVMGQVTAVSKQGIAVEYTRTRTSSSEMFLPLSDHVRLERISKLGELKPGDVVKVQYEQTYKEDKDGQPIILNTTATEIAMMRRAPDEGTLMSKAQAGESSE